MLLPKILEWIAEIVWPVVKQLEAWVKAKTKPVAEPCWLLSSSKRESAFMRAFDNLTDIQTE